jgi:hypothetical protein
MITVNKREYSNPFAPEKVNWLLGNTGDWVKLRLEFSTSIEFIGSFSKTVSIEEDNTIVLMNGSSWMNLGFEVGKTIEVSFDVTSSGSTTSVSETRTIVSINNDTLTYDSTNIYMWQTSAYGSPIIPGERANATISNLKIYTDNRPQGILFEYTHLTNDNFDSDNLNSIIDGTLTRFNVNGMDTVAPSVDVDMNPLSFQSGMSISECLAGYISKTGTHTYNYYIELTFLISSFYDTVTNIDENTPPSTTFNANALTDNFRIVCFPTWNNPNSTVSNDFNNTKQLGNTGWFNENFNGLPNPFSIVALTIRDESNIVTDFVDFRNKTKFDVTISEFTNVVDAKFNVGFIYIDENDYQSNQFPFHENSLCSTCGVFASFGSGSFSGPFLGFTNSDERMDIEDLVIINTTPSAYRIRFTLSPNSEFADYFENRNENRRCLVWVSVADGGLSTNESNRVNIPVYAAQMETFVPPIGEYPNFINGFLDHTESFEVCKYQGFAEDDVISSSEFKVDPNTQKIISIEAGHELIHLESGSVYSLGTETRNFETAPIVSGVQVINQDDARNFIYKSDSNKNRFRIKRNSSGDFGDLKSYLIEFPFKCRWEYWIQRSNIPTQFFNTSLPSNGRSNDWVRLSRDLSDYQLQYVVYLTIEENGTRNRYRNGSVVKLRGYNEITDIEKNWNFFNANDLTSLDLTPETGYARGTLPNDTDVLVEVKFKLLNGQNFDLENTHGTINLHRFEGIGQTQHYQLSTIFQAEPSCPLISVDTSGLVKKELVSSDEIKFSCIVKQSLLPLGSVFQLSSRLYGESIGETFYILTEDGERIATEDSDLLIQE